MSARSLSIIALAAAAMILAACGGDESDDTTPVETPAADAAAPAVDAPPPAMDAAAPAMDAPAADAGAPATLVSLEGITGRWAETAELCGTDDEVTITPEAANMADGACIITGTEEVEGALNLSLICPVAGAEPDGGDWVITADSTAPFTAITIAMDDLAMELVRCP